MKFFAYDGCHKIYLLADKKELCEAKNAEFYILSTEHLKTVWDDSCSLRFINTWDMQSVIPQFAKYDQKKVEKFINTYCHDFKMIKKGE